MAQPSTPRPQVAEFFNRMKQSGKKKVAKKATKEITAEHQRQLGAIRIAMAEAKLKQKDLCDILGMSEGNVSRLLDGSISLPLTPEDWGPIARAVGAVAEDLNNGKYTKDPYWFSVRTADTFEKIHKLLDSQETRKQLLTTIDILFGQYVVMPSLSKRGD